MPAWPLTLIISGGQTGADQAGISAARFLNYATGGRAPKDWQTEDGPAPWLAEFGLQASPVASMRSRTYANVISADGVAIFTRDVLDWGTKAERRTKAKRQAALGTGPITPTAVFDAWELTPGSRYTAELAVAHRKDLIINPVTEDQFRNWIYQTQIRTLNIAGSRESLAPGIFTWVYNFLVEALVPF